MGGKGNLPRRLVSCGHPNYPELAVSVLANPTGALFEQLLSGSTQDGEQGAVLGAALADAYDRMRYEVYGLVLDFTTAEAALATIKSPDLPDDLAQWLRNVPIELVLLERDEYAKNFRAFLQRGS